MTSHRCPVCKSTLIRIGYPLIQCASCGYNEPLIDFSISWDYHRGLCLEYGKVDPGPCEILEQVVDIVPEPVKIIAKQIMKREVVKQVAKDTNKVISYQGGL